MYQCASWHTGVDFNDFLMSSPEARARPGKTKWSKLTKAVHSLFLVVRLGGRVAVGGAGGSGTVSVMENPWKTV